MIARFPDVGVYVPLKGLRRLALYIRNSCSRIKLCPCTYKCIFQAIELFLTRIQITYIFLPFVPRVTDLVVFYSTTRDVLWMVVDSN